MSYHLYLSVEEIDHPFPDDTELFFRLYDIEKKEYIRLLDMFVVEAISYLNFLLMLTCLHRIQQHFKDVALNR